MIADVPTNPGPESLEMHKICKHSMESAEVQLQFNELWRKPTSDSSLCF